MEIAKHDNEFVFKYLTIKLRVTDDQSESETINGVFLWRKNGEKVKVFYATAAATFAFRHLCSHHIHVLV